MIKPITMSMECCVFPKWVFPHLFHDVINIPCQPWHFGCILQNTLYNLRTQNSFFQVLFQFLFISDTLQKTSILIAFSVNNGLFQLQIICRWLWKYYSKYTGHQHRHVTIYTPWNLETLLTKQKSTLQGAVQRKVIFVLKSLHSL